MNMKPKADGMTREPMDPRVEVANELKQHLMGMTLTHRKLKSQIAEDAKKKKKVPGSADPEDEGGEGANVDLDEVGGEG